MDARLVTGLLLMAGAVAIGAHVVSRAEARSRVLAFTRDLAPGATVRADDLRYVRVGMRGSQVEAYMTRIDQMRGKRTARAVARDELVARAAVAPATRTTTIAIPLGAGAAPDLHRGQRVAVWAVAPGCGVTELVSDVTVQAVADGDDGLGHAGAQRVVVELPDADAFNLVTVLARDDVELRAGIRSGEQRSARRGECVDAGG